MSEVHSSQHPHQLQIASARHQRGLTVPQAAALIYVAPFDWREWEDGSKPMPWGLWELFLIKTASL